MKTILYITHHYKPSSFAAGLRAERFIEALSNHYRVVVVTLAESPSIQSGQDNLKVYRIGQNGDIPSELNCSDCNNWPEHLDLPGPDLDPTLARALYRSGQAIIGQEKPEWIFTTAPPFPYLAVGAQLSKLHQIPHVIEFRDAWFTGMYWPYQNRSQKSSAKRWEKECVDSAEKIITVTDTYRDILIDQYGKQINDKIITIRHGIFSSEMNFPQGADDQLILDNNKFNFVYTGQLRGLDVVSTSRVLKPFLNIARGVKRLATGATHCENLMLEWMSPHILFTSISTLVKKNPDLKNKIHVSFVGREFSEIDEWIKRLNIETMVTQYGLQPFHKARSIAQQANSLIMSLYGIRGMDYHWCVPSKIYTYMGTGNHVLALLPPGEAADIITRSGLGKVVHPEDQIGLTNSIEELYHNWQQGQKLSQPDWDYINQFKFDDQVEKMIRCIGRV